MPSDDLTADDQPSTDASSESAPSSESADPDAPDRSGASPATDDTSDANTSAEDANAPAEPSVPEGFGEVPDDREGSRWAGYALGGLLAAVFLIGLVRVVYPNVSILVIGTLLALFGVLVGVLAVREQFQQS